MLFSLLSMMKYKKISKYIFSYFYSANNLGYSLKLKFTQNGGFRYKHSINHVLVYFIDRVKTSEPRTWGKSALLTN